MRRQITIALLSIIFVLTSSANQVKVDSKLSSIEMLVGQQVQLTVEATVADSDVVVFPQQGLLPDGIEFLGKVDIPDETTENGRRIKRRGYILTSFIDTLYYIPPFTVTINGIEYDTKKLALKVLTVDVDTTDYEKYFGPKSVQDNPFDWNLDNWPKTIYLSLLLIIVSAISLFFYIRLRNNKPVVFKIRKVKRLLPHQKAMKEIEEIKSEKLNTIDDPKEYYTRLTDTLRRYIEERYGFNAMEMTSSEIIEHLTEKGDKESLKELVLLFETSDLVKFAKYSTYVNENDANLVNAIEFINKTKSEQLITEEVIKPILSFDDMKSIKSRRILIIGLSLSCIIVFILYTYILFLVIDLML